MLATGSKLQADITVQETPLSQYADIVTPLYSTFTIIL